METKPYDLTIEATCPDCGIEVETDAIIDGDAAYWNCPSTWCERTFIDPEKVTTYDA